MRVVVDAFDDDDDDDATATMRIVTVYDAHTPVHDGHTSRMTTTMPRTKRCGENVGVIIVKLGGAALTDKRARGRVDRRGFEDCIETVARAVALGTHRFIVVHGAGGFGHAEAKACGCARGGDYETDARFRAGVDETRSKVRELNGIVVSALRARGVDAEGTSPSSEGWRTRGVGAEDETSTSGRESAVIDRARRDVVPVIHGDVVFDEKQGTSVLSGDDIVRWCARWVVDDGLVDSAKRVRCVFCSDVFGVYDAAPTCALLPRDDEDLTTPLGVAEEETATLIREIVVKDAPSESWTCVSAARLRDVAHPSRRDADTEAAGDNDDVPEPPHISLTLSSDVDDVTGGVATKLACAVSIARDVGADVYITRAGDVADARDASSTVINHALAIMSAPMDDTNDDARNLFLGTVVRRAERHRAIE